jgi:DNA modification methylase
MIINGDALTVLKRMDSESVHMAVTSSPYYGLRSYGTEPQIWDGDPNCQHEWGTVHPPGYRSSDTKPGPLQSEGNTNRQNLKSDVCSKCGAWKGELGSEPTPELFVKHLTDIYREVRRVLRNDGILWANIGDSYASSGVSGPISNTSSLQRGDGINPKHEKLSFGRAPTTHGFKPKDLIEIPSMLASSLRADGWYLRSRLPWIKRNSLPSSVTDRPSSSIEYVFLLTKSGDTTYWTHPTANGTRQRPEPDYLYTNKLTGEITSTPPENWKEDPFDSWKRKNQWVGHDYFYDHIATMQPSSESYNKDKRPRGKLRQTVNENSKYPDEGQFKKVNTIPCGSNGEIVFRKQDGTGNPTTTGFNARYKAGRERYESRVTEPGTNGQNYGHCGDRADGLRFMRDSDFFFKTWQGLLHNEDGEPMSLVVNPRGYKGAHFACFPIQLVEPLILAGTSEHGVCPHCGAPWTRTIKKTSTTAHDGKTECDYEVGSAANRLALLRQHARENGEEYSTAVQTTGWSPSCSCQNNTPVPAIVLDPFGGSSATGVACKLHNRNYIGIELNPAYCKLGEQRVRDGK